jgi:hypothetical protein
MTTSAPLRSRSSTKSGSSASSHQTAEKHRAIQTQQDLHDHDHSAQNQGTTARQGATTQRAAPGPGHEEPTPPLPRQHLDKPGLEADMQLKPRYQAQHYRGSGKLDGMSVLITGGDSGIGRAVAVLCAREGADVAIAYLSEHEDARETCALIEAEGGRSLALAGDVKDADFCNEAVGKVVKTFGKLNVLINNAAFQEHAASLDELGPVHPIFARCVVMPKGQAQGDKRSWGVAPARPGNAADGPWASQPEGKASPAAPLVAAFLAKPPALASSRA